MSSSNRNNQNK